MLSMQVWAKKLYKYQDAEGRWYYTDKAPIGKSAQAFQVEVKQLKVEPKQRVWLNKSGTKQQPDYAINNAFFGPIEVEFNFEQQRNVRASPVLPLTRIIRPGVSGILFTVVAVNPAHSWRYTLRYRYTLGDPAAQHNEQAAYYPPFASYRRFPITQAFNGRFSHTNAQSQYAVDFAMPEGSEVHAARAGIVMSLDNDFFKGGVDKKAYMARANSVRILHDDGSMAIYAHLQVERAQVYEGMRVKAGQLIAFSGNTGFSSGPHLHFAVQVNKGMRLVSVPFKFTDIKGRSAVPKAGQVLAGFVVPR